MKLFIIIKLFAFCFFSFAETSVCKNSPVVLNSKNDWEKYKIFEWNNCYGELKQNYKNKKKWNSHFKNGLPNGYGTVRYENLNGYFQGYFKDGKMDGVGKYVNKKGKTFIVHCEKNDCERKNIDLGNYENDNFLYYKDNILKDKKSINNSKFFINKIVPADLINKKNNILEYNSNIPSKTNNITLNNNNLNYKTHSFSNETIKSNRKKTIKYFK